MSLEVLSQVQIKIPPRGSAGGKAMAIVQRRSAMQAYNDNPSRCKGCAKPIALKEDEKIQRAQRRRYCGPACRDLTRSTSSTFPAQITGMCAICGTEFQYTKKHRDSYVRRFCSLTCGRTSATRAVGKQLLSDDRTKGDLFASSKSWQSARTTIRRHAAIVIVRDVAEKKCKVCGYANHVEIAHIRAVSDFSDEATLGQINSPNNLIYLCPNHHWEYDNGQIQL
jgi:hypothetical protein